MRNLLTFDIEEWWQANYRSSAAVPEGRTDPRLELNVDRILALCRKHNTRATFFILGQTAARFPGMVRRIESAGHEIASHGFRHALISEMTPAEFSSELEKALSLLSDITGRRVRGFRAPSWSVRLDMSWFFETLAGAGLEYDSSLFPVKTFLFGDRRAARFPHRLAGLIEIPASTVSVAGRRIPFAAGFFFRFFPLSFISRAIRTLNRRGQPAVVVLHPREFDPEGPRLQLPWRERFIQYVHVRHTEKKLDRLLSMFLFGPIGDALDSHEIAL